MRRTTVVRLRGLRFVDAVNQNNTLLLMLLVSLLGILVGALKVKNGGSDYFSALSERLISYISARDGTGFISMFFSAAGIWFPFVIAAFLSGTSLAGMAIVPIIVAYYGYTYGIFAGYLYAAHSITGIGFCLLIILPARAISIFALMLAGRESFGFSIMMAKLTLPSYQSSRAYSDFRNYCLRYLFILIILTVSTLVDCLFSASFIRFFGF